MNSRFSVTSQFTVLVSIFIVVGLAACGGGKLPEGSQDKVELPEGHPPTDGGQAPFAGSKLGTQDETDGDALPLRLTGLNSAEELKRDMAATQNAEARDLFASGFRKTFCADAARRDYVSAAQELQKAVELDPGYAPAFRALGYARFNMGFDVPAAMENYQKAVDLDPDYGEAHYALAFMYAMNDREKGKVHFRKAMDLGIADERSLGTKFYSQ